MLPAGTLVIKSWKFRKAKIGRAEVTVRAGLDLARAVALRFIDAHDFSVAHIGDRVGPLERAERLHRRIVRRNPARKAERIPDRGVFRPEPVNGETARLRIAQRVQLVEKADDVEEPDRVFLVSVIVIEIRAVIRRRDCAFFDARDTRATHRFWKADQFGAMRAVCPIVSVAAERDDPLLGICVLEERVQPGLKPLARGERPGRVGVGSFIEKERDKAIDLFRDIVEIDVIEILPRRNAEPKLQAGGV